MATEYDILSAINLDDIGDLLPLEYSSIDGSSDDCELIILTQEGQTFLIKATELEND